MIAGNYFGNWLVTQMSVSWAVFRENDGGEAAEHDDEQDTQPGDEAAEEEERKSERRQPGDLC